MKNDSNELRAIADTQQAGPRHDAYTGIHKALRALMCDTLLAVGRMDAHDEPELAQTCQRVSGLLNQCISHLTHENDFMHTAMEARAPGASGHVAREHEEHREHVAALQAQVDQLLDSPTAQRDVLALGLYRSLSLFVAENFEHMNVEETAHNAVLWAHYNDTELGGIHDALVASIPPQEMAWTLRWLVPYMNPAERAGMLGQMQAHAPAEVFNGAINIVRPHLTDGEWLKLARALKLPVVAGLVEPW